MQQAIFVTYWLFLKIIEDSEERLTSDQEIEDLLNVIATKLPDSQEETMKEKAEDEDDASP